MRGRTKANTESVSINDIVETEEKAAEATDLLSSLKELVPTLKQYNEDIRKDENNVINARLGMEGTVTWAGEHQSAIEKRHKTVEDKFDEVIKHIDKLLEEAPTKLVVTVAISETDKAAIEQQYKKHIEEMTAKHDKQMTDIRQLLHAREESAVREASKRSHEIYQTLQNGDGLFVSGFWYWVYNTFFVLGLGLFVYVIFMMINSATYISVQMQSGESIIPQWHSQLLV